jgi:hypothetical protein
MSSTDMDLTPITYTVHLVFYRSTSQTIHVIITTITTIIPQLIISLRFIFFPMCTLFKKSPQSQARLNAGKSEDHGIDNKHHLNYNVLTEGDKCQV